MMLRTPSRLPSSLAPAAAIVLCAMALAGCAGTVPSPVIDRLTPEQLAALPPAPAERVAEAARLTQQADREARQAAEAQAARQRELQRWRDYQRLHPRWSAGIGYGYPYRRFGWGGRYWY